MQTAVNAKTVSAQVVAADRRILSIAEIGTRAKDPIPASHTDSPREAKQDQMNYLARNMQFPVLKLCPILGLGGRSGDVIAATSLGEKKSRVI
jgi:hypothetical protein